jgi:hypothetical protein
VKLDPSALLVLATVVRVFAPNFRRAVRLLLRAGVRAGAVALLEDTQRRAPVHDPLPRVSRDQEV